MDLTNGYSNEVIKRPMVMENYYGELAEMFNSKNNFDSDGIYSNEKLSRERRRNSVLKNVYTKCRGDQKRKSKDFCLYLANLYQNVKGFHGL